MSLRRHGLFHAIPTVVAAILPLLIVLGLAAPALALNANDLPAQPPASHVLDQAQLLSRASAGDISRSLDRFHEQGIEATWLSVARLDYDLSLPKLAEQTLERWHGSASEQLLLVIDGQTSGTAIVASQALQERLSPDLLKSTSRTTMAQPLREGSRYRQASLDAINRLSAVLNGEPDPGEPIVASNPVPVASVPTREETLSGNATTWVIVLLVVGTIVPMLTWWVFSR